MNPTNNPYASTGLVNAPRTGDFESIINLLAVLGEANRQLAALEREIEAGYVALVTPHRERYAKLQATVSETEAALEVISRRNQAWFAESKNVKTPYGVVKFTSSSELVVADEGISVQLVKALAGKDGEANLLRTVQVLNREALEKLTDGELARFAIVRKTKENFKVGTTVVDLGKAVAAADKSAAAAAKAAKKAQEAVAS
jgi:hypothetical protein